MQDPVKRGSGVVVSPKQKQTSGLQQGTYVTYTRKGNLFLMTDDIIMIIVKCTNKIIELDAANYKRQEDIEEQTVQADVMTLIGLLLISWVQRDNHFTTLTTDSLLYPASMSEARFTFLINSLRFDDRETIEPKMESDKLSPIRRLWVMLIKKCEQMYV